MKVPAPCAIILSALVTLTGCSTPSTKTSAPDYAQRSPEYHESQSLQIEKKDPAAISLLKNHEIPPVHYTVIGEATVSKYNVAGIKRQKAIIQDRLRELAASMGGDAVINQRNEGRYVTGTVISYQVLKT